MRKWTTIGLLFLAAASVYAGEAAAAKRVKSAAAPTSDGAETVVTPVNGADATATAVARAPVAADKAPATPTAGDATTTAAAPAADAAPGSGATTKPSSSASSSDDAASVAKNQVNVSDGGTVEIHVNEANLVEVLRMLSMQAQTNILPSKDVRGTVTANLYDVTIREALDAILRANGYEYKQKGNVIYVYSAKEAKEMADADRQMVTEVFHLFYTPAANAQTMIKPVLSPGAQVAVTTPAVAGIESGGKETGGNNHANEDMMVVTDYPENIEKIRKIVKEIDRRPQQILVEATILQASLNEDNALGVDFSLLGGVNFSSISSLSGQLTGVNAGSAGSSGSSSGSSTSGNTIPSQRGVVSGGGTGNNFTNGINGLRVGVVTNNVAVFLSALEEVTDTVVLANPKVLVLNKQKGEVKVARQDPFRGKTTVNENGLSQQEVEFLETGTKLVFRPFIGDDGYIRMEVHPEDSSPIASRAADLPPTKLTTETTTNIMVKDGHTVVIGGLFRETAQSTRSQVPGLGNIPGLGNLFRKKQDTTQREEVIILLTPHVIKDEQAYAKLGAEEAAHAEKLRVGVRRGMMPWGRERLAECHYEKALSEWNKPNPDRGKVLWHLNCATNLNPMFLEAIELKQKVTGKEVTTADNSSVRMLLKKQIMAERTAAATGGAERTPQPASAAAPSTTQPTKDESAAAKGAAPSTQPGVVATAAPATQPSGKSAEQAYTVKVLPVVSDDEDDGAGDLMAEQQSPKGAPVESEPAAASPATRPSEAAVKPLSNSATVTIREVTDDDVKDAPNRADK